MRQAFGAISVAALIFVAHDVHAAPILNGSFEGGTFDGGADATHSLPPGSTTITSWTVVNDTIAWIGAGNPWSLSAQDGDLFLDLTDFISGAPFGGVTQTLSTEIGAEYRLTYYLGSYTALWGGPPVSIIASAGATSQTCTDPATSTESTWTLCTMQFTATAITTPVTLVGSAGANYIGLDNVAVELVDGPSVPEPAVVFLLAPALAIGVRRYLRGA